MFIVSKDYGIILNFNNIVEMFTGGDGDAILARQMDGKVIKLQEYENRTEAKEAISIIADDMTRKDVVYIPRQDEVKGRIVNSEIMREHNHNIKGKKTKGHGGS